LAPLEVVYGVDAGAGADAGGSSSAIEERVLYHARHPGGGFDVGAQLRLQHARPENLAVGEVTLFDALEQARVIRPLLGGARGADAEDFNPPERAGRDGLNPTELEARVVGAENGLLAAHKALVALVAKPTAATSEALRTNLLELGSYGLGP